MENENKENIQSEQDEIVTVELGHEAEVKSVEEEIADATPTEAPEEHEEPTEEPTEAPAEEEEKVVEEEKEEEGTTPSENPSPEKEEAAEEEKESKSDDTPAAEEDEGEEKKEDDENKEEPESDEQTTENEAQEVDEDAATDKGEELERIQKELAEYKEKEERREMEAKIDGAIHNAVNQFDDFADKLSKALDDTFKQYGIDPDKTLDELRASDPAKASIAEELIHHAEAIRDQKIREFQAPIIEAQKALVFREASKMMCDYDMSDAQAQEAATTLVDIINQVGIANLDDDLKAKVELSVARAKMLVHDEAAKEEIKVEEIKEAEVEKDIKKEKADEPSKEEEQTKEEQKEAPFEPPTEAPTEAPKADLEAFKEGASTGDVVVNNNDDTTVDNVLEKLAKLPYREQLAFYKKNAELIKQAGIKRYKQQGLR